MIESRAALEKLFSPIKIGSMELKNRIVMPPMTTVLGGADGEVTDRFIDFYAARARGGAALITAEAVDVHPYTHNLSLGDRGFTAIYDDRFIPGLKRLTDTIHVDRHSVSTSSKGKVVPRRVSEVGRPADRVIVRPIRDPDLGDPGTER